MTEDEVQTFLHRWWDCVWHEGDVGLIDEIVAERYVQHSANGNVTFTREELKRRMVQYQRVLHHAATTVDAHVLDGDTLWMRATSKGANLETDAASVVTWMLAYRFDGGRVAEGWVATLPNVDWTR